MLALLRMSTNHFDLAAAASAELVREHFQLQRPEGSEEQLAAILAGRVAPVSTQQDLRSLPWSSIDNDTSRDLDQIEVAERVDGGIRIKVAIADVASVVAQGSPLDNFARDQTQTIYTAVHNFPMLPNELSTGLTSLNENEDRAAIVTEFVVTPDGKLAEQTIYSAMVRNTAQLTYNKIGPWLEGHAAPDAKVAASEVLQKQLRLQEEATGALREQRNRDGALDFQRGEAVPVVADGKIQSLTSSTHNRAMALIEDLMIASNETVAFKLHQARRSGLRRIVRSPERWQRIVDLAALHNGQLPPTPDSGALNSFLTTQRASDPDHYADLALAIIKLIGAGEYVLARGDDPYPLGHFALAASDYAHSTAPNRRFADLVTQRVVKAMLANEPPPYTDDELSAIAEQCNERDKDARKVERSMVKRVAAIALSGSIGKQFRGVITGVTNKGTFVRVLDPPVEGMLVRGAAGLDVGDRVNVTLVHTNPEHAFIDFAKT
jgi:VacB/RNase II family 3'-5' exoribonuclease